METQYIILILIILGILFTIMTFAWMTSSRLNDNEYGKASSTNLWIIFISGLSFIFMLIYGGYLIYQSRKQIAKVITTTTKQVAKRAGTGLQKLAE